ncbi:hypothetical protein DL95DRAFT_525985 [Leptodontidium sp. 2 PMI_412]|nr:hypothetical protein DL95DRAFT_525985 [Leptodontidium sp. 2 PMI_412]
MSTARASRRPHTKSRNGCGQCKKRKVKCDELGPKCSNCSKWRELCDYEVFGLPTCNPVGKKSTLGDFRCEVNRRFLASSPDPIPSPPNINLEHLELMHHYAVSTSQTFHNFGDGRWDVLIPAQAQSYEFLMHALLGVSALHISHLKGRDGKDSSTMQYLLRAHTHHTKALTLFRSTITDITPTNGTATAFFSHLLLIFSCGTLQPPKPGQGEDHAQDPIYSVVTIIRYFRSYWKLFADADNWAAAAGTSPYGSSPPSTNTRFPSTINALNDLLQFNAMYPHSDTHKAIYHDTIIQLRLSLNCGSALPRNLWPLSISDEYISLLERKEPMALVIVAYGTNLTVEQMRWFVDEWVAHITRGIAGLVGEEWRECMRWPLLQCGWRDDGGGRDVFLVPS